MESAHFLYNKIFVLFTFIPLIGFILYIFYRKKDKVLRTFASEKLLSKIITPIKWKIRIWKILFFCLAILFCIISLARPRWGIYFQDIEKSGRELVILLDLSKSMLAEDVIPNRLGRAKSDLEELLTSLKGDKISLIGFAGKAEIRCPLTLDYNFFREALKECNPGTVPLGGTAISEGIRKAFELFKIEDEKKTSKSWLEKAFGNNSFREESIEEAYKNRAIILITDGEDHESSPLALAEKARKMKIKIFTIGIGDSKEGSRIPDKKTTFKINKEGQIIWSKMDKKTLQEIAFKTQGKYLFIGPGLISAQVKAESIKDIYEYYISDLSEKKHKTSKQKKVQERFQIFIFFAIIFFLIESLLNEGTKR